MILKMLGMNVLVKQIEEDNKTQGGIFMPENRQEGPLIRGEVLGVGSGELQYGQMVNIEDIDAGDIVVVDRRYSLPFKVQDQTQPCFIVSYKDILAKEKEN